MKTKTACAVIATSLVVSACFPSFDKPREAGDSNLMTGLWKIETAFGGGENKTLSEPFVFVDQGDPTDLLDALGTTVKITSCSDRSVVDGLLVGRQTLTGVPGEDSDLHFKVNWPTKSNFMRNEGNVTTQVARQGRKMSNTPAFDMGSYNITSSILPNATITNDNCTITQTVSKPSEYSETFNIVVGYNGGLLTTTIKFVERVKAKSYDIDASASKGSVEVTLSGDQLVGSLGNSEISLTDGTLTISKRNNVWLNGTISSSLPGGGTLEINFEAELPIL